MNTLPTQPDAAAPERGTDRSLLARLGFGRRTDAPSARPAAGRRDAAPTGRPLETPPEGSPPIDAMALDAAFDGLHDGLVVVDAAGRIVRCNRAAAAMFGAPAAKLVGTPAETLLPAEMLQPGPTGLGGRRRRLEARRQDGMPFQADLASETLEVGGDPHVLVLATDASMAEQGARELAAVREAALDASRAKSRFLVNVSHEVRTPMNGLLGLAGLLRDTTLTAPQRELLEGIERSAQSLQSLIDQVIEVADLEAGRLQLRQSDFDPVDAVEDAIARVARRAAAKGLALGYAFDGDAPPPPMHGDDLRFREVLRHLLDNAVSFTASGHVQLRLAFSETERLLEVVVRDSGPGVPASRRAQLFQAFTQLDDSASRSHGGVGLGLAICRQLIDLMGGSIGHGDAPEGGSDFRFSIPWRPAIERDSIGDTRTRVARLAGRAVAAVGLDPMQRAQLAAWGLQVREPAAAAREPRLPLLVAAADATALAFAQKIAAARAGSPCAPVVLVLAHSSAQTTSMARVDLPRLDAPIRVRALVAALDGTVAASHGAPQPAAAAAAPMVPAAPLAPAAPVAPATAASGDPAPQTAAGTADTSRAPDGPAAADVSLAAIVAAGGLASVAGTTPGSTGAGPAVSRAEVLVVEDNEVNQMLAVALLARVGVDATVVGDGERALERLAARRWDAVLMDVQMPGLDGLETTRRWRVIERAHGLARTPVIALTANATEDDRERCLAAGMDDYLAKPLDRASLEARMARWVVAERPVEG